MIAPPSRSEYPDYFHRYIALVPTADVIVGLEAQRVQGTALMARVNAELASHRYAPAKWTVQEVFGHIVDVERMLAYWAWCFARGDVSARPAVDCEAYVREARFSSRPFEVLQEEYGAVRAASLALLRTIDTDAQKTAGLTAAGPLTSRAIAYVIAGHELHHWQILRDRYRLS